DSIFIPLYWVALKILHFFNGPAVREETIFLVAVKRIFIAQSKTAGLEEVWLQRFFAGFHADDRIGSKSHPFLKVEGEVLHALRIGSGFQYGFHQVRRTGEYLPIVFA